MLEQGDGAGRFTEVQRVSLDSNARAAALADLDGDGRLDLAADGHGGTDGGRSGLYVLFGSAGGRLQAPVYYASCGGQLVAADVNLDGSPDLMSTPSAAQAMFGLAVNLHR